jgi:four helix bundle protein
MLAAREMGMTSQNNPRAHGLPHHHLIAWQVAVDFLSAVRAAKIKDADLRNQAMRAAKSVCLNTAEVAGRKSRADKSRVFAIARGEAVEAIAAIEIAGYAGDTTEEAAQTCVALGGRLVALLSGLMR